MDTTPEDARIEALEAALKPFAALYSKQHHRLPDRHMVLCLDKTVITVGDLRRAKEALEKPWTSRKP